jgi:hypothetical protein
VWELENATPFLVDRAIVVDKTGERHWVVVIKGTFDIKPNGELERSRSPVEIHKAPKYRGEPGQSSIIYEQDIVPAKSRTDLYLNATAYAPRGRSVTELQVGLKFAGRFKALVVKGDRCWERGASRWRVPAPKAFVTMPIIYERAHGGYDQLHTDPAKQRMDARNPVGTGAFADRTEIECPLPNIEHPDGAGDRGPAGFGAICSFWEPRKRYHGTYDAAWAQRQKPLLALDFDPLFLQCAPADQQCHPPLRGGETMELLNLTPDGVLRFALPRRHFGLTTQAGSKVMTHGSVLDTVVIEPNEPRVIMVWKSMLSCHHDIEEIDFTRIIERRMV